MVQPGLDHGGGGVGFKFAWKLYDFDHRARLGQAANCFRGGGHGCRRGGVLAGS